MLIHSGLDTATRTDIIDKFDYRTDVEEGEARPRVLVSTTDIAGKGFTCVRAKHVWLMEPAFRERDEKQAYSRVRRYGQKAKVALSLFLSPLFFHFFYFSLMLTVLQVLVLVPVRYAV